MTTTCTDITTGDRFEVVTESGARYVATVEVARDEQIVGTFDRLAEHEVINQPGRIYAGVPFAALVPVVGRSWRLTLDDGPLTTSPVVAVEL